MKYNETIITALEARRADLDDQLEEHRNIIATLDAEREAINRELLVSGPVIIETTATHNPAPAEKKKRKWSKAARARIARTMKARWKERRAKAKKKAA